MPAKQKKCVRGYQCGSSCISPTKKCRKKLGDDLSNIVNELVNKSLDNTFQDLFEAERQIEGR